MKSHKISNRCKDAILGTPCSTVMRMCSDFRDQAADAFGSINGPCLSVAIAYEDFVAGINAMRTFQGLFDLNERQFHFDMHNSWKFDFLRIAELRESAIAETSRADLIIVSLHTTPELPSAVKWWLETALERREGDPGALVLLENGGRRHGSRHLTAEEYLAKCAWRNGLDFFVKRAHGKQETQPQGAEMGGMETADIRLRDNGTQVNKARSYRRLNMADAR